jgi:hypothetical protein
MERVEKEADGNTEIANRPLTVTYGVSGNMVITDVVANWRDPIVTAVSPLPGATNVPTSTLVTATWSQAISVTVLTTTTFRLQGPTGVVAGAYSYDSGTRVATFTPGAPLAAGTTYTVTITGVTDIVGDVQQIGEVWTFHGVAPPPTVGSCRWCSITDEW